MKLSVRSTRLFESFVRLLEEIMCQITTEFAVFLNNLKNPVQSLASRQQPLSIVFVLKKILLRWINMLLIIHKSYFVAVVNKLNITKSDSVRIITWNMYLHAHKIQLTQELIPAGHGHYLEFFNWIIEHITRNAQFCNKLSLVTRLIFILKIMSVNKITAFGDGKSSCDLGPTNRPTSMWFVCLRYHRFVLF